MPGPTKHDGLEPPILVEDAGGLERLLADLAGQDEIAVDTEADSFYRYREQVCLIQITVEDRDYLVDPLAKVQLEGVGKILADPRKIKVFHDGEYDVLILKRDFSYTFRNLFDTRVAAAALGFTTPGLAAVIADRFGVELDKSLQRSNWSNRPLTQRQIDYARLDTHYLLPLMDELAQTHQGTLLVVKVDTDQAPDLSQKWGIRSIPTLILFKEGEEVGRSVGFEPEKVKAMAEEAVRPA